MKRFMALLLTSVLLVSLVLTGCGKKKDPATTEATKKPVATTAAATKAPAVVTVTDDPTVKKINVWSFTKEVPDMLTKYKALHSDFAVEVKTTIIPTTEGAYQPALDTALASGGASAPDLYTAEAAFVLKYTQGDAAKYAAAYADLGIDVAKLTAEADIAKYTIDMGTNTDGKLVGLGYQATGGAFIYRRSIATATWGTDAPETIKTKIGPGWDAFFAAAADLKAKGYKIVSGEGDIWHAVENSAKQGWIVDGKLTLDPDREAFFDLAKKLKDNGYSSNAKDWTDAWFADMTKTSKVFGFFGPAWLINYVLAAHSGGKKVGEGSYGDWAVCEPTIGFMWGGTWILGNKATKLPKTVGSIIQWITLDSSDTGLQYFWANGTLAGPGGTKDTVASGTVMTKSDGKLDFIGGQNMFDAFVPAGKSANGANKTQYDETINQKFRDQVSAFVEGKKSKEKAIADFKQNVADTIDIEVE